MNATEVIAIFDIGKTNKKFFLFDKHYSILFENSVRLTEIRDEDGDPCENINELTDFILSSLNQIRQRKEFQIKAINFSAYGASFVYVNQKGQPIAPLYNYLKSYPVHLQEKFYHAYGPPDKLGLETASPMLGSLNSGLQLFRLKYEKPKLFEKVTYALHLPQYISSIVTGIACSDITSIGCHTMLWDFQKHNYHDWVFREQLNTILAPIHPAHHPIALSFDGNKYISGIGLHDSSAALVPYLFHFKEPFVLLSTGTWNISFNPFNNTNLTNRQLDHDCLFYLTYEGKPVKSSRLFSGYVHETEVKRIAAHFNIRPEKIIHLKFDPSVLSRLEMKKGANENKTFNSLESVFSSRNLSLFDSAEEAYYQLILDIAKQQFFSTSLLLKEAPVKKIFVNGGLSKNSVYMNILSGEFAGIDVYAASIAESSALGAALVLHPAWNMEMLSQDFIHLEKYPLATEKGTIH